MVETEAESLLLDLAHRWRTAAIRATPERAAVLEACANELERVGIDAIEEATIAADDKYAQLVSTAEQVRDEWHAGAEMDELADELEMLDEALNGLDS